MSLLNRGILFSLLTHGFVVLLMFFLTLHIDLPSPKELIEVVFDPSPPIPPVEKVIATSSMQPAISQNTEVDKDFDAPSTVTASSDIDLPTVTTEFDPVDISDLPLNKQPQRPLSNLRATDNDALNPVHNQNIPTGTNTNYLTTKHQNINIDGFTDELSTRLGNTSAFDITGDVINRKLIQSVLPEYPPNVMRSGAVTMQFTVRQNGTVGNIEVVRGNYPEFSIISVEALKKWIFDRADREHSGRITFNFTLE
ncbi:MAG: hypothetical protein FWG20_04185 [Candidatus Cloacimonetes bacterium]|nr:hypothetical protein [Candidatus Cloacimonadota bacterium]